MEQTLSHAFLNNILLKHTQDGDLYCAFYSTDVWQFTSGHLKASVELLQEKGMHLNSHNANRNIRQRSETKFPALSGLDVHWGYKQLCWAHFLAGWQRKEHWAAHVALQLTRAEKDLTHLSLKAFEIDFHHQSDTLTLFGKVPKWRADKVIAESTLRWGW